MKLLFRDGKSLIPQGFVDVGQVSADAWRR